MFPPEFHPDGEWFQQDHDGLDRPTMLSRQGVPALTLLVYDATGLPYVMGLGNGYNRFFGYDAVQRITSFSNDLAGTAADASWTFPRNAAGQIASVTRDNDAYAWTGHYAVQRAYTTNGLNQYSAAGSASFTYDTNGNLITTPGPGAGEVLTYGYDVENRLVGRTSNGASPTVSLSYDPLGRLFSVTSAAVTTQFLYDGNAMVAEYDAAGTLTHRYVHGEGADVPLVQYNGTDPNQIRFLYGDQQGSIVAMSDGAGTMTQIDTYDEYGIPGASNTGRFQYTGQAWFAEIGMYYYKARIYSPTLGRFLQTDPVGYADQYNLYAYVGNDPVNRNDPSGTTFVVRAGSEVPMDAMINSLTRSHYANDSRGVYHKVEGGPQNPRGSVAYDRLMDRMIASQRTVVVQVAQTVTSLGRTSDVDEVHGGGVTGVALNQDVIVTVSGHAQDRALAAGGGIVGFSRTLHQSPGQVLMDELAVHADPSMRGIGPNDQTLAPENEIRRELNLPQRGPDDLHPH